MYCMLRRAHFPTNVKPLRFLSLLSHAVAYIAMLQAREGPGWCFQLTMGLKLVVVMATVQWSKWEKLLWSFFPTPPSSYCSRYGVIILLHSQVNITNQYLENPLKLYSLLTVLDSNSWNVDVPNQICVGLVNNCNVYFLRGEASLHFTHWPNGHERTVKITGCWSNLETGTFYKKFAVAPSTKLTSLSHLMSRFSLSWRKDCRSVRKLQTH